MLWRQSRPRREACTSHITPEKYHSGPLDSNPIREGIKNAKGTPLWRCVTKERSIGDGRMTRIDVYRMIKRRCQKAELGSAANCHTFRATGITAYLLNGGTLENAQAIAAHESPRTTKLYDRTSDEITLDEIERIGI